MILMLYYNPYFVLLFDLKTNFVQFSSNSFVLLGLIFHAVNVFCLTSSSDLSDALLPMQPSDVLDMPVDPNEPTYCLCHQVSYGEMIGCDNPDVSVYYLMAKTFISL